MKFFSLILLSLCIIGIKNDNEQKIIDYARKAKRCIYCYGGRGEILTETLLKKLVKIHGIDNVRPDIQRKYIGKCVFDCGGLVEKAFNEVGIRIPNGATSAWRGVSWAKKGVISELPKDKIAVLYKDRGDGRMKHTGIYIKGNSVIHAKGTSSGIVEENIDSYPWTHYGIPKKLYE